MVILIDNGHGIYTKGKCSPDGRLREWAWAREIAKRVQQRLVAEGIDASEIINKIIECSTNGKAKEVIELIISTQNKEKE